MPTTPSIPEKSHPIYTRHKPDAPSHNCTTPLHSLRHSLDRTHVTTYLQHGLQAKKGRPVKPLERLRDFF